MLRLNMNAVSLLHADIFDNQEGHEFVTLDNTDETWGIAVAAELATDDSVTPVRSVERLFKIRYDVLFPFLDALVFESAEKTPRVREND